MEVKADPYQNPKSFSYNFRKNRFELVKSLIEDILSKKGSCRIIDVGGTETYWNIAQDFIDNENIKVDLVNLDESPVSKSNFRSLIGDARDLSQFGDNSYDLVHSNSVIEHVGVWHDMTRMAQQVRRLAPSYYVQTPYFWFPYEPHFRFPIYHWLPEQIRYRLLMNMQLGFMAKQDDVDGAMRGVQSAVLLDHRQYSALFPDSKIHCERIFKILTKSLVAIRHND